MEFDSPSDSRLAARAIREGWPMTPQDRARAIAHLKQVVGDPATRSQLRRIAQRALEGVGVSEGMQ
jgi:hypothetical protein